MPLGITPENVYQQVNKYRTKSGLDELRWDNRLADAALVRAKELFESKTWSHDLNGKHADAYVTNKQEFDLIGENLARKFRNSENMVNAWKKSPTHNKNLLQDFTSTGVATYGNVTVQLFGRYTKPTVTLQKKFIPKKK